jgi:hypothetical protein
VSLQGRIAAPVRAGAWRAPARGANGLSEGRFGPLAAHDRPPAEVEGRGDEYVGFYGARPSTPAADVAFVTGWKAASVQGG